MSGRSRSSSRGSSARRSSSSRSRSRSASGRSRSGSPSRASRSSSSSSSPRFVSATDSEADRGSDGSGGKEKRRVKAKDRKVSSQLASRISEADEDDEEDAKPKAKQQQQPKKKGKAAAATTSRRKREEEEEEGEVSSEDEDEKEFDDGLDEDLKGDESDRARLAELTEREREEELFKRAENRENLRKRFEIQKKLKLQEKQLKKKRPPPAPPEKEEEDSEEEEEEGEEEERDEADYGSYSNVAADAKVRAQDRQKKLDSLRYDKKSDALSQLKAKRQEREQRKREEEQNEKGEDGQNQQRSRSSSSSSSSGSSTRRRSSSSSSSSSSSKSGGSGSDGAEASSPAAQKYIETEVDLEPSRLSRFKLEKFVHLPFFRKLVTGCFVRIGIGQSNNGVSTYRLAEVADVVETAKVYSLGKVRTNAGARLRFGRDERVFRLEFVSNQQPSPAEFAKWKGAVESSNLALPTCESVRAKAAEIRRAMSYEYTSEDVDKIVAAKERFHRHPKNYAMHKARLLREKEAAVGAGDDDRAREIEEKLNELEERAEELDRKRTSTISTVALINDRNRKANVSKAEEAIREQMRRSRAEGGAESNPFTRRKCNPRMVTKAAALADAEVEKENQVEEAAVAVLPPAAKRPRTEEPSVTTKEDMFDAHDFDIEIDVDTNAGGPAASSAAGSAATASVAAPLKPAPLASKDPAAPPSKRSLNLDDYKKKRGLI